VGKGVSVAMCWPVHMMQQLGREYPRLRHLVKLTAKKHGVTLEEEWDELGEAAGMWYDYGPEDFQDPKARRRFALSLMSFLSSYLSS